MSKFISESFPNAIDLGFCPVSQYTTRTFYLENNTSKQASFSFEKCAYKFEPSEDIIPPKSKVPIQVSHFPNEATVLIATTNLVVTNEPYRTIKLSAIGKYPYIGLSTNKLEFDKLLVGKKVSKELIIKNQSQVPTSFQIQKTDDDSFKDNSFSIDVTNGEIPPKASFLVKVTYSPSIVNLISCTHYNIICTGGNTIQFESKGEASGLDIKLSADSINFGEIKLGSTTSRMLLLQNDSDLPAVFQFYSDKKSIFGLSHTTGTINSKSTFRVIISFNPVNTMNYYQRLYCLIRNHQLLYVDLLGTCFDLLNRPKPILQKHIDMFRKRVTEGRIEKEDFVQIKTNFTLDEQTKKKLLLNASLSSVTKIQQSNPQIDAYPDEIVTNEHITELTNQVILHKELMLELGSENRLIMLNVSFIS